MNRPPYFLCLFLALSLPSCNWDGYQHAKIMGDSDTRVHVLYDSSAVQRAADQLLQAKQRYVSGFSHNEKEGMAAFLESQKLSHRLADDLRKEPGYDAQGQVWFKILIEADILPYSKVEFDDGPLKGQVGWLWRGSIDDPRTHMP